MRSTQLAAVLLLGSVFAWLLGGPVSGFGQCEKPSDQCANQLDPFNSDGDFYYRAQLFPGEMAKLRYSFFTGMRYRIIPCGTSDTGANLVFDVFDQTGLRVYTSKTNPGKGYYDIEFGASGQYLIEASFTEGEGCASILVGYMDADEASRLE